jgi:1-deoxy-D-xylulose-5-phosphate reductoisomerase
LLFAAARASGALLLPVDSEHSALFQCLVGEAPESVATLVLTASGGPFWGKDAEAIRSATVADALRHPTWQMGTKNTIDSASMMNKGLEVIEASRFFGIPGERIAVAVHRTSIAHGFVIFRDGNVKAQLAPPDMRLPIGYALAYPDRLAEIPSADPFASLGASAGDAAVRLEFERPDFERFPCLGLAYEALRRGGTVPAALSAANEIVVRAFVNGELPFGGIPEVVREVLLGTPDEPLTLGAVRAADARARDLARTAVEARRHRSLDSRRSIG